MNCPIEKMTLGGYMYNNCCIYDTILPEFFEYLHPKLSSGAFGCFAKVLRKIAECG